MAVSSFVVAGDEVDDASTALAEVELFGVTMIVGIKDALECDGKESADDDDDESAEFTAAGTDD